MLKGDIQAYIETIALTIGLVVLSFSLSPADPLLIHSEFPWIWFIPTLIALRHGRMAAALAVAIIILAMLHTINLGQFPWKSYQLWLLGGLTLTLICSEFYAYWLRQQYSLRQKSHYLDNRIDSLSRAYGVLRLSHDQLEESLITKPATLRQSLLELRELLLKSQDKFTPDIANAYMEILDIHAGLNSAALFLRQNKQWHKHPIAFIGESFSLEMNDVLVKRCLTKHHAAYVAINVLEENAISHYLAVVPMEDANRHLMGLLVIKEMPFLVLNDETLKKLTLLLAYIADEVWAAQKAVTLQKIFPDCPAFFASELFKLDHLCQLTKVDSSIVAFYLPPSPQREDILFFLKEDKRVLDVNWQMLRGNTIILLVLTPLTARSMLIGYIQRISTLLLRQFNLILGENPIFLQYRQLSAYKDVNALLTDLITNDITI